MVKGDIVSKYTINPSRTARKKIIGRWPMEMDDMVLLISVPPYTLHVLPLQALEVETYLNAIQSDVQQKKMVKNLHIAKFVLWQEV
jgi:hypothetical protein